MSINNTEEIYSLYIDGDIVFTDSLEKTCREKMDEIVTNYKNLHTDRNFIIDEYDDNFFTIISYPKNYATSYERIEFYACII